MWITSVQITLPDSNLCLKKKSIAMSVTAAIIDLQPRLHGIFLITQSFLFYSIASWIHVVFKKMCHLFTDIWQDLRCESYSWPNRCMKATTEWRVICNFLPVVTISFLSILVIRITDISSHIACGMPSPTQQDKSGYSFNCTHMVTFSFCTNPSCFRL